MHKQNKGGGYDLAGRIFRENGPKIMKFKIPVKGRKETSKSKENDFPENGLKPALKDWSQGPEVQVQKREASTGMGAADRPGLQNVLPPERAEKKIDLYGIF